MAWQGPGTLCYYTTFCAYLYTGTIAAGGKIKTEFPDVYIHTHLSENLDEIAWVKELFPEQQGYLEVYHHYGLTGERSVFAHCVHLQEQEWDCLHQSKSAIAFCPTSNLFLEAGCFHCLKPGKTGKGWPRD